MYVKHVMVSVVILAACLITSSAFAVEPVLCDPEEDPDGCECSDADECYEVVPSTLISPDDPEALREAAQIESFWDEEREVFYVVADTTQLTAAGVMKLNSNHGHWENRAEMLDYLGALIGQDLSDFRCIPEALPPILVHQTGITVRYDQFNEAWAPANSGNIVFDAISDEDGYVFFAGAAFNLFAESSCGGTDQHASDRESGDEAAANQCSIAADANTGVSCEPEPLGVDCGPDRCETLGVEYATTELMTADMLKRIDNGIRCVGDWIDGELRCHPEESKIIRERVVADRLRLETSYFNSGSFDNEAEPIDQPNQTDGVHYKGGVNGVCSEGRVERGGTFLQLQTRDGAYDSSAEQCIFE